ncbi:hypothetical protein D3C76_1397820 [compost metagenome]
MNIEFLKNIPNKNATNIPRKYSDPTTKASLPLKNMLANTKYTGSLALQLIKGTNKAVSFLSFSLSKVRADIIAGTVHPKPTIIGMNALPDKPIFLINLSIIKATLAM